MLSVAEAGLCTSLQSLGHVTMKLDGSFTLISPSGVGYTVYTVVLMKHKVTTFRYTMLENKPDC